MSNEYVQVLFDDKDVLKIALRMGNLWRNTPVVITRAANKAATKVRTDIDKETTERYLTQKRAVHRTGTLHKATYSTLSAQLVYKDTFRNLARWAGRPGGNAVRPLYPHQGWNNDKPKNYFAHVKRSNALKALTGVGEIPFRQEAKGYNLLFRRTGRSRYPIKGVAAPAIPQVVKNKDTLNTVSKTAYEVMSKEAARQMELYLSGKL